MKTIDTCEETRYSPLIPAIAAICHAKVGESLKIIINDTDIFGDLKAYLSEQNIGFREIYDGDQMSLEFTIS
ncbi:sulfurtransferase TusA family protein [Bacteroides ihuae]|uniref:sulfurtransferase TusA family protein n=1 Tax=Bacteroides ihuae TaxID=1852362 RepID=UPI0008D964EE|nr:sulfurtransferase TusA family protein [Bacteroides ihuae]